MLAVIQNEEDASGLEVAHECVDEGTTWGLLDPQDGGDGLEDQSGVGKRGKLHEPHPVLEPLDGPGCHREGEAGLAGASWARKGEQAVLGEQRLDLGHLPFAPDKAGQLQRQIVAGAPGSSHRLQVFLPILGWFWRILISETPGSSSGTSVALPVVVSQDPTRCLIRVYNNSLPAPILCGGRRLQPACGLVRCEALAHTGFQSRR